MAVFICTEAISERLTEVHTPLLVLGVVTRKPQGIVVVSDVYFWLVGNFT